MSFYEKPDDDFSQKEPEVGQENNEDITNIEENKRNSLNNQNNNNQNITKKKNRTLQYYKSVALSVLERPFHFPLGGLFM